MAAVLDETIHAVLNGIRELIDEDGTWQKPGHQSGSWTGNSLVYELEVRISASSGTLVPIIKILRDLKVLSKIEVKEKRHGNCRNWSKRQFLWTLTKPNAKVLRDNGAYILDEEEA
jgi:hypothetical protein